MSKILVEIGYERFLLPSDAGIATIIKALSGAVRVSYADRRENGGTVYKVKDETVEISVKQVSPRDRFITEETEEPIDFQRPKKAGGKGVIIPIPVRDELPAAQQILRLDGPQRRSR